MVHSLENILPSFCFLSWFTHLETFRTSFRSLHPSTSSETKTHWKRFLKKRIKSLQHFQCTFVFYAKFMQIKNKFYKNNSVNKYTKQYNMKKDNNQYTNLYNQYCNQYQDQNLYNNYQQYQQPNLYNLYNIYTIQ